MEETKPLGWTVSLTHASTPIVLRALWTVPPQGSQTHWALDFEPIVSDQGINSNNADIQLDDGHITEEQRALLLTDLPKVLTDHKSSPTILRLLFPSVAGTVIRSDFLSYRLNGSPLIHSVRSFLSPLQAVTPTPILTPSTQPRDKPSLLNLLATSHGGLIANGTPASPPQSPPPTTPLLTLPSLTTALNTDLLYRLSTPWTVPHPLTRRRIFWIQGRAHITASQQFYAAAHALGITLVVCDVPGHWMEPDDATQNPWARYREAFVPMNIDADEGLAERIVQAVRAYPEEVHGVVCISDVRLAAVARACEVLGLPTEGSEAYRVAGDKGLTRRLEEEVYGRESFVLEGAEGLERVFEEREGRLRYPLIVKPCTGWNSDAVTKVRDEEELRLAVKRAAERHANSAARNTRVVVEPYISGPEVDANFIILDGEELFCDIVDDFPCPGDLVPAEGGDKGRTFAANFMETLMDVPTALPEEEQSVVRESLCRSIARAGFKSGVFHCEARVRDSAHEYRPRADNGLLDVHEKEAGTGEQRKASCYLHEINARTPGYINCVAALLAHGVDYYAIRLLLALGEEGKERIRALAQPFARNKPQYTLGIVVLPPKREGIMGSEDAVGEFLEANPDLAKHVVFYQTVKQRGEFVQGPDSTELWCVGYLIVASRRGRTEVLELSDAARKRFDYQLMEA
ncbi:hypothetical protein VTJ49DRAFT_6412 [Mycothermus thermophilus]|uniref:ATP-grasp domain-containing protein n=1 Tax=Humicola insolens TaxID=85995 RepID=A0ABR3VRI5_HUMIN